jgi:hypothetical protein
MTRHTVRTTRAPVQHLPGATLPAEDRHTQSFAGIRQRSSGVRSKRTKPSRTDRRSSIRRSPLARSNRAPPRYASDPRSRGYLFSLETTFTGLAAFCLPLVAAARSESPCAPSPLPNPRASRAHRVGPSRPVVGSTSGKRSGSPPRLRQFVMPAKLRVPVLEPNVRRQVIGVPVGPLYPANGPLTVPLLAVEQPNQRAYTGLARLHKNHFLISEAAGTVPLADPAASSLPRSCPSPRRYV